MERFNQPGDEDGIVNQLKEAPNILNNILIRDNVSIQSNLWEFNHARVILSNFYEDTYHQLKNIMYLREILMDAELMEINGISLDDDLLKELLDNIDTYLHHCIYLNGDIYDLKEIVDNLEEIDELDNILSEDSNDG